MMTRSRTPFVARLWLELALTLALVVPVALARDTLPGPVGPSAVLADDGKDKDKEAGKKGGDYDDDGGDDEDDGHDDDRDDNRGHGNDEDGFDEDNPGRGGGRGNGNRGRGNADDDRETVAPVATYAVEITCAYDAAADRTSCTFAAGAGTTGLLDIAVPAGAVCAEVMGGDYERGAFAGGPVELAEGYSARAGEAGLVLILAGEVVGGAPATYWVATETGTFPAEGPSLGCAGVDGQFVAVPAAPAVDATAVPTATPPTTGTIEVWAYGCDAPPADPDAFDWYGRCREPIAGTTFTIARRDGDAFVPAGEATTDADGLVRFPDLPPGTYRLDGADSVWCHAESNSVGERGEVVVAAGNGASVWTFYCAES